MGERKKDALRVNFDRVAQDASSETDKDWCQSGETFEICDISHAEVMVSKSLLHEILERIGHLKPVPIGSG